MLNAIHSSFIRIFSLKSSYIIIYLSVAVCCLFSGLFASLTDDLLNVSQILSESSKEVQIVWQLSSSANSILVLFLAIFAILSITNEYSFGTMNVILLANPKRIIVFFASVISVLVYVLTVTFVTIFADFCVVYFVKYNSLKQSFGKLFFDNFTDGVLRQLAISAVVCLFCLALGYLIRNSAGAIATYILVFNFVGQILSLIATFAKNKFLNTSLQFLPDLSLDAFSKGDQVTSEASADVYFTLTANQSGIVIAIWVVLMLAAALILFDRRDAQ